MVDLVLPPADHGAQGRCRPGLLAVGTGTRQRPGPHLAVGGWSASVFVAAEVGGRLRDWGPPVDEGDDLGPGQVELHLGGGDGRYVLVWFTNLGEPGCDALPHQLRVGEVTVVRA